SRFLRVNVRAIGFDGRAAGVSWVVGILRRATSGRRRCGFAAPLTHKHRSRAPSDGEAMRAPEARVPSASGAKRGTSIVGVVLVCAVLAAGGSASTGMKRPSAPRHDIH